MPSRLRLSPSCRAVALAKAGLLSLTSALALFASPFSHAGTFSDDAMISPNLRGEEPVILNLADTGLMTPSTLFHADPAPVVSTVSSASVPSVSVAQPRYTQSFVSFDRSGDGGNSERFATAIGGGVSAPDAILATNNYYGTTGALSGLVWSTSPAGPYTSAFSTTGGGIANFGNTTVLAGGASNTITVAGINATANTTFSTTGGTISNLSNGIVPINVSSGITLDFSTQAFTGSGTAGYTFTGPGVLGMAGGTYGGGFTINSGTLVARGINAMGAGGTLTINGGTIAGSATQDFTGKYTGGITVGGNFQLGALVTAVAISSSTANLTFSNDMALGGATRTITIGANGTYTLGGIISSGGLTVDALALTTGTIVLSGANNYSGGTTITAGTLQMSGAGTLGSTSGALTVNGGTLNLGGTSQTVGALSGSGGTINTSTGTSTLTVGNGGGTGAYSGTIANGSGTVALTKTGAGTETLSGTNSYGGATQVNGGTLLINGNQIAAAGAVSVNNAGTVLGGTGTIGGAVTVNAGANITGGTNGGVGTLTLNSTATFTGASGSLATYLVDLSGATSDRLVLTGALNLGNAFDQILFNGTPDGTTTYILATYSSESGTFNFGSAPAGYQLIYGATALTLAPVPEPSTWIGGALALLAVGWTQRKRFAKRLRVTG